MPLALVQIGTLAMSAVYTLATGVFALTENVQLAVVSGFFAFLTSTVAAVMTYLTRRDMKRQHHTADTDRARIERKVDAPRRISTDREDGVRVEGPDETHTLAGEKDEPT